jgi:HSP20 family protein
MNFWRVSRDPLWGELERFRRGMDELLHGMPSRPAPGTPLWTPACIFPPVNVRERTDAYEVTAEIPGVKAEDLDVKIEGDTLTLKGERKPQEIGEGASYHRRERSAGTFQRSITLPGKVDASKVEAAYKNGLLTVTLAKEPSAMPKQISVAVD